MASQCFCACSLHPILTFPSQQTMLTELLQLLKLLPLSLPMQVNLSTRPEESVGSTEIWQRAESALKSALEQKVRTGLRFYK